MNIFYTVKEDKTEKVNLVSVFAVENNTPSYISHLVLDPKLSPGKQVEALAKARELDYEEIHWL